MCDSSSSASAVNVEQFRSKLSCIVNSKNVPKYKNLTNFVKYQMCIPISKTLNAKEIFQKLIIQKLYTEIGF